MAGSLTWNREGEERFGGVGVAGLYKDLVMPISGAFGVSAEGYVGGIGSAPDASGGWDGGARLFATSRLLFLNVGVDWNARTEKADFILAFTPYFRRGGLFRTGGNFRIEWIPGRGHSFNVGFQIPLEPHMGKTRPVHRDARLPKPASSGRPAPALTEDGQAQLRELRDSGRWLILHANFFNDDDDSSYFKAMEKFRADVEAAKGLFQKKDALHPEGRSYALESRHYDEAFDAAFASAVGPEQGRAVADRAARSCSTRCCCRTTGSSGDSRSPTRSPASRRRAGSRSAGPSTPRRASIPRAGRRRSACSTRSRGCSSGPARS